MPVRISKELLVQPMELNLGGDGRLSTDIKVVKLIGKLGLETVHGFVATMRSESASNLVLDMSRVSFLDSAGVGALVALFVSRRNCGKKLLLAAPTKKGKAVLEVSGLADLLPTFPSLRLAIDQFADALASF
jgi:anti-sigma B factor antagonist